MNFNSRLIRAGLVVFAAGLTDAAIFCQSPKSNLWLVTLSKLEAQEHSFESICRSNSLDAAYFDDMTDESNVKELTLACLDSELEGGANVLYLMKGQDSGMSLAPVIREDEFVEGEKAAEYYFQMKEDSEEMVHVLCQSNRPSNEQFSLLGSDFLYNKALEAEAVRLEEERVVREQKEQEEREQREQEEREQREQEERERKEQEERERKEQEQKASEDREKLAELIVAKLAESAEVQVVKSKEECTVELNSSEQDLDEEKLEEENLIEDLIEEKLEEEKRLKEVEDKLEMVQEMLERMVDSNEEMEFVVDELLNNVESVDSLMEDITNTVDNVSDQVETGINRMEGVNAAVPKTYKSKGMKKFSRKHKNRKQEIKKMRRANKKHLKRRWY